jgi:hypothetical protein
MAYELTGKLKVILEPKTFASGFTVREFVVTVEDGKYPQDIILQVVQDKVSVLDSFKVEDEVAVTFDIRGKEYNDRYFNNLQAWKVERMGDASEVPEPAPKADEPEDDIPF